MDTTVPEVVEAIGAILKAAHDAGIKAGIHCLTTDYAKKMIAQGFNLVTIANDMRLLMAAAGTAVKEMR